MNLSELDLYFCIKLSILKFYINKSNNKTIKPC